MIPTASSRAPAYDWSLGVGVADTVRSAGEAVSGVGGACIKSQM